MRSLYRPRSPRFAMPKFSLPHFLLGLAAMAGVLAALLSALSTPRLLVVFVAIVVAGTLAAGSALHFLRARSPLLFVAAVPGVLGACAVVDAFVQLLAGVRLVDMIA